MTQREGPPQLNTIYDVQRELNANELSIRRTIANNHGNLRAIQPQMDQFRRTKASLESRFGEEEFRQQLLEMADAFHTLSRIRNTVGEIPGQTLEEQQENEREWQHLNSDQDLLGRALLEYRTRLGIRKEDWSDEDIISPVTTVSSSQKGEEFFESPFKMAPKVIPPKKVDMFAYFALAFSAPGDGGDSRNMHDVLLEAGLRNDNRVMTKQNLKLAMWRSIVILRERIKPREGHRKNWEPLTDGEKALVEFIEGATSEQGDKAILLFHYRLQQWINDPKRDSEPRPTVEEFGIPVIPEAAKPSAVEALQAAPVLPMGTPTQERLDKESRLTFDEVGGILGALYVNRGAVVTYEGRDLLTFEIGDDLVRLAQVVRNYNIPNGKTSEEIMAIRAQGLKKLRAILSSDSGLIFQQQIKAPNDAGNQEVTEAVQGMLLNLAGMNRDRFGGHLVDFLEADKVQYVSMHMEKLGKTVQQTPEITRREWAVSKNIADAILALQQ